VVGGHAGTEFTGRQTTPKRPDFHICEICAPDKAQIPLDLSCRTTCRTTSRSTCRTTCRRPGFFSAQNLSETRFPTFFLLKTCRKPGFKQVLSKIDVMEFGQRHVCDFFVRDQVFDFFLLKTCRKSGFKQVLSKIDVMEFGHKLAFTTRQVRAVCFKLIEPVS